MTHKNKGWIGVDLDATLANYSGWRGESQIGFPVQSIVSKIKQILEVDNYDVKIFTARVSTDIPEEKELIIKAINKWCLEHIGRELEITCVKDYNMVQLWDDRAKQVIPNTGLFVQDLLDEAKNLLMEFIDDAPCNLDHDNFCQTHASSYPCKTHRAKTLINKVKPRGF